MNIICSELSLSAFVAIAYFFFFFMPTQEVSYAIDTINSSTTVRDSNGGTLISSGGTYELGFFSTLNSKNRYVGIWYKAISKRTVVWVANRDNPLTDGSGWLKVTEPGCLLLLNGTNGTIWSTNTSRNVQNPVTQLLDSGNLVVRDAHDDNSENFLWQSFNYPTDTYLPGMKLGRNFLTGLEVYIRSWKSSGDPASGDFTIHLDPTGYPQSITKRGEHVLYSSGPWNGISFSGTRQNLQKNTVYTYRKVINKDEAYIYFELQNKSVYSRLVITESGVGQRWVWNDQIKDWNLYFITAPIDNCDNFNQCGPHGKCTPGDSPICACLNKFKPNNPQSWDGGDWSNGCIRSTPLSCNGVAFLKFSGVKLPNTHNSWFNETMTLQHCRVLCSNNCSCTAYTSLDIRNGGSGCLLWFGDLVDMRDMSPGQEVYIKLASSELDSKGKKRKMLIMTLSLVVGIFLLCLSMFLYSQKRKKGHQLSERGRPRLNYVDNCPDEYDSKSLELPLFDLSTIIKATDNFSINNKLGEGGFGPVYKALLDDGREIAVKRLSKTSLQGVDEFKNEVICIAKLQHRNLVKLLGCCVEGAEKMLVYEYMTNKSLDIILFEPTKSITLNWPRRFNIINGIARGLLYLHQDSCLRVIHRDLKASNILLDSYMNPKISDFGLARSFGGNETGANTSRVAGTYGYMSPEYARDGMFSVKSDVFSFGVVVLEIISGKRNRGFSHRAHPGLNLLGHGWVLYREERSPELLDSCVGNSCHLSEVLRSIHVGLLCVQENPQDRPSMSSVVMMLSNDGVLPEAKHPGFFTGMDMLQTETSVSSTTPSSANTMTITLLEAR